MNGAGGATGGGGVGYGGKPGPQDWVKRDSGLSGAVPLGGWSLLAWLHFILLVE